MKTCGTRLWHRPIDVVAATGNCCQACGISASASRLCILAAFNAADTGSDSGAFICARTDNAMRWIVDSARRLLCLCELQSECTDRAGSSETRSSHTFMAWHATTLVLAAQDLSAVLAGHHMCRSGRSSCGLRCRRPPRASHVCCSFYAVLCCA